MDSTAEGDTLNLEQEYGGFLDFLTLRLEEADPVNELLAHHGVKGMRWGVRKGSRVSGKDRAANLKSLGPDKVVRTTASGETLTLEKTPVTKFHRLLARSSSKYTEYYQKGASLSIKDSTGKEVGTAVVGKKGESELNLVWLGIHADSRGKGYATSVMQAAQDFGKESGLKKLTLEVPGNSPDARHIYEKLGFKVTKEPSKLDAATDTVWGGLTEMEYAIDETKHADVVEEFLSHHGVKGMKWGVRKDKGHEGERAKTKKIEKLDRKFERNVDSVSTTFTLHNSAARKTNEKDIDRINNKPEYKDKDFSRDTPLRRKYYKEHQKAYIDNLVIAAQEMGTNASGTKKYSIMETMDGGWDVYLNEVKHADIPDGELEFSLDVEYDALGHILKVSAPEVSHEDFTSASSFLSHYGVKGMRWGKRKATTGKSKEAASEDHVKVEELRKKPTPALTNQQLTAINKRLQLEQTYNELSGKKGTIMKGNRKAKQYMEVANTAQSMYNFATSPMVKKGFELANKML